MNQTDPHRVSAEGEPIPEYSPPPTTETDSVDTASNSSRIIRRKGFSKQTVFWICIATAATLVFCISVIEPLARALRFILSVLSPILIGVVIAYLCDPILEFFEYRVFRNLPRGGIRRGISLLCTLLTAIAILGLIGVMIIPQLYQSITSLFDNSNQHIGDLLLWVQSFIDKLPVELDISSPEKLEKFLVNAFGSAENALSQILSFMQGVVKMESLAGGIWQFLKTLFTGFTNVFLGIFIAFYILASKEKRVAQIQKFRRAVLSERSNSYLDELTSLADHTFGGFIFGKLVDSAVIGILTFVLLTIFNISEYNVLIAAFVGITNVIPVFGPFIGAIPSFFIVLISSPSKAFLFLILILIIQQLDGNIIGPKILGDNTGISSLCVIIAISVCSALWGVAGMLIGVPLFAMIIELVRRMLEHRLAKQGKPTETLAYYPADAVGNAEKDIYYEHAHLLYHYRRSKLKPIVDRIRFGPSGASSAKKKMTPAEKKAAKARRKADKNR